MRKIKKPERKRDIISVNKLNIMKKSFIKFVNIVIVSCLITPVNFFKKLLRK